MINLPKVVWSQRGLLRQRDSANLNVCICHIQLNDCYPCGQLLAVTCPEHELFLAISHRHNDPESVVLVDAHFRGHLSEVDQAFLDSFFRVEVVVKLEVCADNVIALPIQPEIPLNLAQLIDPPMDRPVFKIEDIVRKHLKTILLYGTGRSRYPSAGRVLVYL